MSPFRPYPKKFAATGLLVIALLPATATTVAAQTGKIGSSQIVDRVGEFLTLELQSAAIARGATRTDVVVGALDSRLRLDDCGAHMQMSADLSKPRSRVNVRVTCGGEAPWGMYVPANVSIYKPVVVAARNLSRGETLGSADITKEERDILASGSVPLEDTEQAVGLLVNRSVSQGIELTGKMLERPVLVKRGDRITLTSTAGGIAVSTTVEARENGKEGERIRVKNLSSGRTVDAIVAPDGSVYVTS